ncbi:GNAT family N-acetyltransferase [Chitinimonas naiadis]
MARTGIYKSEVKKARDALLAQGRRPSVDAVRIELGNTGSKTTIQRHLRELDEEESAGFGQGVAVSDAIQDLVGKLAGRLQEEAEARIIELRTQYDAKLSEKDALLGQHRAEIDGLRGQLQRTEGALNTETAGHAEARRALAEAGTTNERLIQQVTDLNDRLKDNEAHRQSLEEKHQHTREALEHYRQSVKDQREQEQRRHEHQVQQLQVEIRTLSQTMIVKQDELTRLHQELATSTAELAAAKRDLRRETLALENAHRQQTQLQQQVSDLNATMTSLASHVQQGEVARIELNRQLGLQLELSQEQGAEIAQLKAQGPVRAVRLAMVEKPSLAPAYIAHLEKRLALPQHERDRGPASCWNKYAQGIYAVMDVDLGKPVAIVEASGVDHVEPAWWVDSEFRGKGYGSALIDVLVVHLRSRGVTRLGRIPIDSLVPEEAAASTRMAAKLRERWDKLDSPC